MASVNKVILVGNVGKDPEVRYLDSGVAVASITLATTERGYTLQNGTQVPDRTEWHNVIAWKHSAEYAEKYVKKGAQLFVEGKIVTKSWEKDGVKQYRTDIVAENIQLLGSKPAGSPEKPDNHTTQAPAAKNEGSDDLPF